MNKTNFHKIKLMFYAILAQKEYVFSFYFRKKWVTSKWRTLYKETDILDYVASMSAEIQQNLFT